MTRVAVKLFFEQLKKLSSIRRMSGGGDVKNQLNLKERRAKYNDGCNVFTEEDLVDKDPIVQFKTWMEEALQTPEILEANAMCLATASRDGMPSARFVLLKGFDSTGFQFYTNYNSRKGKELDENPHAALTFYWEPLKRSVRIEGKVEKLAETESDDYFHSRPRDSQIGACVSQQSEVVASRDVILKKLDEFAKEFGTGEIPKPKHWGGYKVIPDSIEFWQGQSNRLHDRIKFRKLVVDEVIDNSVTHMGKGGWVYERLHP